MITLVLSLLAIKEKETYLEKLNRNLQPSANLPQRDSYTHLFLVVLKMVKGALESGQC